jgi:hypothetical protein
VRKISPPPGFDLQTVVCDRERGREKKTLSYRFITHTLFNKPTLEFNSSTHLILTAPASLNHPDKILKV